MRSSTFYGIHFVLDYFTIYNFFSSVLETEKSLVLAEKGSGDNNDVELIRAAESFRLVATMNPGGDFGKKEVGWSFPLSIEEVIKWISSLTLSFFLRSSLLLSGTVSRRSGVLRATAAVTWFRSSSTTFAQDSPSTVSSAGDESDIPAGGIHHRG